MNQRLQLSLGTAVPSPGYNGILNALAACSAHSSAFLWNGYTEKVRDLVNSIFMVPATNDGMIPGKLMPL
jgi:hypothetical protein